MRTLAAALVLLAGCSADGPSGGHASDVDAAPPEVDHSDDCDGTGGLPTPACGNATVCPCCVGCNLASGVCMSLDSDFNFGTGQCTARSQGSLTADDGDATFAATDVAAVANDAYMQISGTAGGGHTLAMQIPAQLGSFDCTASTAAWFVYYSAAGVSWNRPVSDRPACSVTITAIGAVGEPIEGAFTIGFGTTVLDNGTFSIVRVAYP